MNRMMSCYTTPSMLLRRQLNQLRWVDELMDDLWTQPRMEIWPASRLHRNFFDSFRDIERQMTRDFERMLGWSDRRLQALSHEDAQLKVIEDGEKEFTVNFGVKDFTPEQIKCKLDGSYLQVEGKHEQQDEHGTTKRHFVRRVLLPENAEPEQVNCTFKPDGVLTVTIPKKQPAIEEPKVEKVIPIEYEKKK